MTKLKRTSSCLLELCYCCTDGVYGVCCVADVCCIEIFAKIVSCLGIITAFMLN